MRKLFLMVISCVVAWLVAIAVKPPRPLESQKPAAPELANTTSTALRAATATLMTNAVQRGAAKANGNASASATPANWEESLDQILRAEKPESEKAMELLAALPTLEEREQIDTAHHLVNLLADEQFAQVKPLLLNTNTVAEVISILFHDSMLRPNAVKEPLFLEVMQVEGHPFAAQAKEALEVYVGQDFKTDWPQWETALREKLKAEEKE